jgi:hypothetical protein
MCWQKFKSLSVHNTAINSALHFIQGTFLYKPRTVEAVIFMFGIPMKQLYKHQLKAYNLIILPPMIHLYTNSSLTHSHSCWRRLLFQDNSDIKFKYYVNNINTTSRNENQSSKTFDDLSRKISLISCALRLLWKNRSQPNKYLHSFSTSKGRTT